MESDEKKMFLNTVSAPILRPLAVYTSLRVFCLLLKASKSGLLGQKSGGLFKFCCSGGLIKSGAPKI